jgi:hypothetical protein
MGSLQSSPKLPPSGNTMHAIFAEFQVLYPKFRFDQQPVEKSKQLRA